MEEELKQMVKDMHRALCGDEYNKEGIVHKVTKHEARLDKHDRIIYGIIGAYLFLVFLLTFGDKLIRLL